MTGRLLSAVVASLLAAVSTAAFAAEQHVLYVARAPKDRDGFRELKPSIEVHDIADGHKLVRVIPLPKNVFNVRGICGSAATGRLYVSHYDSFKGHPKAEPGGGMLCLDLATDKVLWDKHYPPSCDRMAITPDGAKIYFPSGEDTPANVWTVIDAKSGDVLTRIAHTGFAHNTICSLDGKRVFLQGFGIPSQEVKGEPGKPIEDKNPNDEFTHENGFLSDHDRTIAVADTATDKIVKLVGPFGERTRPFTINGAGSLVFCTTHDLIGFEVGDVATGKVLFKAEPPRGTMIAGKPFEQMKPTQNYTLCHGIAMTADEKEVWCVDIRQNGLHAFDVSGLPAKPPRWLAFVKTRNGKPDIFGQPAWLASTIDGRFFYPESGEIVDTREKKVVGTLTGADGKMSHSRFILEVVLRDGKVAEVGDQFGVGRVR